jgi:hypothetical protein
MFFLHPTKWYKTVGNGTDLASNGMGVPAPHIIFNVPCTITQRNLSSLIHNHINSQTEHIIKTVLITNFICIVLQ